MFLKEHSVKPIYLQIAEWLENEILSQSLREEERIYSQYQLAEIFNINPATAAKGLNLLADAGVVYKKRGLGMYVAAGARGHILDKRRNQVLEEMVADLTGEAKRLEVGEEEIVRMVRRSFKKREEKRDGRNSRG